MSEIKIKVLHIIKSLGRGGAETLLPESLKLHDQSLFEFHYLYFLPWKDQLVEAIRKNGGIVHAIPASNNIQIMFKVREVIQYIKRNNISIVHSHLPWAGILSRLIHRSTGIPVLYTEHNKQERYHILTRWANRITFNWQSMAIAVSTDVAESIENNIHPVIPIRTILNGVNANFYQRDLPSGLRLRQQVGIPEDALVVGTVAVFRFQKRLKEWLTVFAQASMVNPKLHGIIIGDGPLRNEIESYREELQLNEKVIMVGLQTDVKPWYNVLDVFMMTSVFEGLPIALLEAMSMGCAIVTTDAGGIKEVVRNEVDGLRVPVDEWASLSSQLARLADNHELRNQLATSARQRVVEHFSLQRMVNELEEVYKHSCRLHL